MKISLPPQYKRWAYWEKRLYLYARLMRLDRPVGIYLLMWPTLGALWIAASGVPDPLVFVVFTLGVVLMRSAGCVINDYADRKVDGKVERTRGRVLVAGYLPEKEALVLFVILCVVAFLLVLLLNRLTIMLSFVGVLLAAIYPFMKRWTYLPQVVLGMAFAWAIPMAFAAQTGEIPQIAWLLFIATVLWTTAYDTMYAMVDRKDDLLIGVKSTAILFGRADRLMIGFLQVLTLIVMLIVGYQLKLGPFYFIGLSIAAVLAVHQQTLIYKRHPRNCFKAFLNNNWFGAAIFGGILLHYAASSYCT
ncbi:MAG: 4-hydroxybenzoate octaprenyltransferase [Gammaproteobacteria bacterium]|nr:4-hydroxybenzoate octaprenyltransferase [Gammaproteobacteria bacterium]